MSGSSVIFDDKKIKNFFFYRNRKPFSVSDIDEYFIKNTDF